MLQVLEFGNGNRAVQGHHMNAASSRSHSVFLMNVDGRDKITKSTKSGTIFLVDLAGSERVGKTGVKSSKMMEEAKKINQSLSALGNVINALTSAKSDIHIPYRDSKLTRLLQNSLGGNAQTTLIITLSPSV